MGVPIRIYSGPHLPVPMTYLGPSIQITGDLSGEEDVTIHGRVIGSIVSSQHTVVIAAEARIQADVRGAQVIVLGKMRGAIVAADRIELGPASTVAGSLSANQVVMREGAHFNGNIDMNQRTIAAKLASYKRYTKPDPVAARSTPRIMRRPD